MKDEYKTAVKLKENSLDHLKPLVALTGAGIIEFNLEPTPLTPYVDESNFGLSGQTLPAWWHSISGNFQE
ncbi:MAG: hypothetical protein A2Z14_07955 [Chloroflexi bacterium RBG_16_48_8]|nr:MAG: hypothetical protein A2Z14_07955 [Chloroflexi bacterium RBG_16_48_8]